MSHRQPATHALNTSLVVVVAVCELGRHKRHCTHTRMRQRGCCQDRHANVRVGPAPVGHQEGVTVGGARVQREPVPDADAQADDKAAQKRRVAGAGLPLAAKEVVWPCASAQHTATPSAAGRQDWRQAVTAGGHKATRTLPARRSGAVHIDARQGAKEARAGPQHTGALCVWPRQYWPESKQVQQRDGCGREQVVGHLMTPTTERVRPGGHHSGDT